MYGLVPCHRLYIQRYSAIRAWIPTRYHQESHAEKAAELDHIHVGSPCFPAQQSFGDEILN